jgi:hypothetical protein
MLAPPTVLVEWYYEPVGRYEIVVLGDHCLSISQFTSTERFEIGDRVMLGDVIVQVREIERGNGHQLATRLVCSLTPQADADGETSSGANWAPGSS